MAVDRSHRHPKAGAYPSTRQIKTCGDPDSLDAQTIAWHFHRLDWKHGVWGWEELKAPKWKAILQRLISFEGLTWASIKEAAGGKKHGTNHHSLRISELNSTARKRIVELGLDEYDKVFSLRLANTIRIYGIRDGRVMRLIWYDSSHGTKNGVCPTS